MDMFLKQDELAVEQYASRKAMGEAAAKEVAAKIAGLQREKESVNIIFAAAPSQNEFLEALIAAPGIDWRRVNGFHMDEYIGLAADAPQGFGNFLRGRLFGRLPFGQVFYLDGQAADPQAEWHDIRRCWPNIRSISSVWASARTGISPLTTRMWPGSTIRCASK